jgi:[CysO sulfur-carrier protein]-S-L-cysteine hydrolase
MFELPRALYDEIVEHARAGLPNEACGVIAGDDGRPIQVYPMRNAEQSPVVYRFDSREQLQVSNEIDEKGWETLAFFHSHTHTEAYPSPTDRNEAHWPDPFTGEVSPRHPGTRYLILSLAEDEPVLRAFNLDGPEPVEEDVTIR